MNGSQPEELGKEVISLGKRSFTTDLEYEGWGFDFLTVAWCSGGPLSP